MVMVFLSFLTTCISVNCFGVVYAVGALYTDLYTLLTVCIR